MRKLVHLGIPERQFLKYDFLLKSPWLQKLLEKLTFNCPETYTEILKILEKVDKNESAFLLFLSDYQKQKIKNQINLNLKTLAIYYPTSAYRLNLGSEDMYQAIRDQGYNVIYLFGELANDEFEKRPMSFYAGHDIVGHLDFVDTFIIPTLTPGLPKCSKKVLFVHDIYDSPRGIAEAPSPAKPGKAQRVSPLIDELDYTVLPCTALMPKSNKSELIRKKPLCRIPGGYIKLDENIKQFENLNTSIDSIIYAPTVHKDHFYDYVSVPHFGSQIIQVLLESFPEYKIIFRPHPHTVDSPEVQKVANSFANQSRFEFDTTPSFYMNNYARSKLMVTDMSGTAFTFAFTTLRPVIFFSHNDHNVENVFGKISYFKDRKKIGHVVANISSLREKINYILENYSKWSAKIQSFRDGVIFNIGKAEDYLAKNIPYIMEDKKHPEWQYVNCPIIPLDDEDDPNNKVKTINPVLMEEGYKGFNIIFFGNKFYGLPQEEGEFKFEKVRNQEYSYCVETDSYLEVKQVIDDYLLKK
ncbi:hypothetical protein ACTRW9_10780 [Nitrospina sp. 32_T5]|uniref:hypothetical protein n=1 Tax=unclassified Nitrospina TaxID=2638683 RepID=UPI003F9D6569